MGRKEKVLLRRAETYNPVTISAIIGDGLREFGLGDRVRGRVTIKPNVVFAHHKVAPSAFTRPEFLDGLVTALEMNARPGTSISVAEKCGAAIPTSRMFRRAGYYRSGGSTVSRSIHGIRRRKKVPLAKGKIHERSTAREIVERDFLVYAPKLKTNFLAHGLTGALKLNIGILCDGERMWSHHYNLDEKIVDLPEVGLSRFYRHRRHRMRPSGEPADPARPPSGSRHHGDGPAGPRCRLRPHPPPRPAESGIWPRPGARVWPDRPRRHRDRRRYHARRARARTASWDTGFIRVEDVDGNIKVLCGEPYCTGGCHGVFLDWMYMIKDRKPELWNNLPPWTVVIGEYKGDVKADRLVLLGKCTKVQGRLKARHKRKDRRLPAQAQDHRDVAFPQGRHHQSHVPARPDHRRLSVLFPVLDEAALSGEVLRDAVP